MDDRQDVGDGPHPAFSGESGWHHRGQDQDRGHEANQPWHKGERRREWQTAKESTDAEGARIVPVEEVVRRFIGDMKRESHRRSKPGPAEMSHYCGIIPIDASHVSTSCGHLVMGNAV